MISINPWMENFDKVLRSVGNFKHSAKLISDCDKKITKHVVTVIGDAILTKALIFSLYSLNELNAILSKYGYRYAASCYENPVLVPIVPDTIVTDGIFIKFGHDGEPMPMDELVDGRKFDDISLLQMEIMKACWHKKTNCAIYAFSNIEHCPVKIGQSFA